MWPLFVSLFVLLLQDPGTPSPAFTVKPLAWAILAGPWLLARGVGAPPPAWRTSAALWLAYTGWALAVRAEPALDLAAAAGLALLTVWAWPFARTLEPDRWAAVLALGALGGQLAHALFLGGPWVGGALPLGNPNLNAYAAAALLLILLPRVRRLLPLAGALACLALMAVAQSRGAWLAAGLGLLPVAAAQRGAGWARVAAGLAMALVGGLALAVGLGAFEDASLGERARWWAGSFALWREHPWTGVGPGRWMLEFPGTGLAADNLRLVVRRPHNGLYRLLAETGLVGAVPVLLAWAVAWWKGLRGRENAVWAGVGIVAAVSLLFDFPAESFPLLLGGMLWWNAAWPRGAFARTRGWTVAFAAAWLLLGTGTAWRWQAARAAEAVERARLADAPVALDAALHRAAYWGVRTQEDGLPLDGLRARRWLARGDTAAAERALERALRTAPRCVPALNDAAALALQRDRPEEALVWLDRGLQGSPEAVDLNVNRGLALYALGRTAEAAQAVADLDSVACGPVRWRLVRALRAAGSPEGH